MLVLDDSTPVRKFTAADAADMPAFYRAVRARRERAHLRVVPKKDPPPIVVEPTIEPAVPIRDWLRVSTAYVETKYRPIELVAIVARTFDVLINDIESGRRNVYVTFARHVAFWLCNRFTTRSSPEIGRRIGGKDHTTVLHGVKRMQAIIDRRKITSRHDTPEAWAIALCMRAPTRDAE